MQLLVLPVSGGGFVTQLAIIQHLTMISYKPDLTFASSGGNLAAYIAAAADWNWAGIERIARDLTQNLFVEPWNTSATISLLLGFFRGSFYNKGQGVLDFLKTRFTARSIVEYEIWTGTYNLERQKSRLFCNRSSFTSQLDIDSVDYELTQSLPPLFANGDLEILAKVAIASAAIPVIVPPQKIDTQEYVDGGVSGASPLTIMAEAILQNIEQSKQPLHITYINSVDLSSPIISPSFNVFSSVRRVTSDMVRASTVVDRLSAYELLSRRSGELEKMEFTCSYSNLLRLAELRKDLPCSLLEIYPLKQIEIDIINFNGNDVLHAMNLAFSSCACRFWSPSQEKQINVEIAKLL